MKAPFVLTVALLVALASPAAALPLYFNGPGNFGTQETDAMAALAADPQLSLFDLDTTTLDFSPAGGAGLPNPTCAAAPSDPTCLNLTVMIPPSLPVDLSMDPSKADPTLATSMWEVTNTSGFALDIAYIVFVSTVGALTGDPELVALEPPGSQGYELITFLAGGGFGQIYYAAVDLGTMSLDETRTISVNYVVADDLIPAGGMQFLLPILNTQAIILPAVPEPGAGSLLALGLLGLAAKRRRSCA